MRGTANVRISCEEPKKPSRGSSSKKRNIEEQSGRDWFTPADDAVYTVQHNWGTFLKDEENITIKLERW